MLELAQFYGWTLDYLRSLTMYELDRARAFMINQKKQQQLGGGQQANGSKRH